MKKLILILVFSLLLVSFLVAGIVEAVPMRHNSNATKSPNLRYETVWFQETFENGQGAWYSEDGQVPSHNWHLTNNAALTHGGSGHSWWMGDPALNGYTNAQLIYLQTPLITVPTSGPTLTFDVNWRIEDLDVYQEYDGWDGANVRISTDGETWVVLQPTSPAYNATSMYGFGYNGEGAGIPGWGGSSGGWLEASFDLSAYAGQSVYIRWIFGSDPAYSTADDPALFGIVVDNINLGTFSHNFDDGDMQGMTIGSHKPPVGDFWHIGTQSNAPSPTHVYKCQTEQGSYVENMFNYLYSDWVELPEYGEIRADFMVTGSFNPGGTDATRNYWGWEIRVEDGPWRAMSNPYGTPGMPNYIYVDLPPSWASMVDSYSLEGLISDFRGRSVQFRWYLRTQTLPVIGEGMMIDNFTIYQIVVLPPPRDIVAEITADNKVSMSWKSVNHIEDFEPGWFSHSKMDNIDAIGWDYDNPYIIIPSNRFSHSQLNEFQVLGGNLTKVAFYHRENGPTNHTLKVWTGGNGVSNPGSLVLDQPITQSLVAGQWNEVVMNTPVPIEQNTELRFGVYMEVLPGMFAAAIDGGPVLHQFGNLIYVEEEYGSWRTLSAQFPNNFMVRGYAEDQSGNAIVLSNGYTPFYGEEYGHDVDPDAHLQRNMGTRNTRNDFDHTGYKVLRKAATNDFVEIAALGNNVTTYIDETPLLNNINQYQVIATYAEGDSDPTNTVSVFLVAPSVVLLSHDDGEDEAATTGAGTWLNYFTQSNHTEGRYHVMAMSFYLTQVMGGTLMLQVWDVESDDQGNPIPNQMVYSQSVPGGVANNLGWNYVVLNDNDALHIPADRGFFIGFNGPANASRIGVDDSTSGMSYFRAAQTGPFSIIDNGVYMLRAYIDISNDESGGGSILPSRLSTINYPNPFNPETTISYNMPTDGHVSIQVYNIRGQLVNTLLNDEVKAGNNTVIWTGIDQYGKSVTSGVYFYRVQTANETIVNKMLLMK